MTQLRPAEDRASVRAVSDPAPGVIVHILVSHPDGRDKDLEGDDAVEQDRAHGVR